jgi:hypothetical protein
VAETVALPDELRSALTGHGIRSLVEYLAERLDCDDGERQMRFELSNGSLRRTRLGHEPIGNTELEWLAKMASRLRDAGVDA